MQHSIAGVPAAEEFWDPEYATLPPVLEQQLQASGYASLRNALVCDAAHTLRAYHRIVNDDGELSRASSFAVGLDDLLGGDRCTNCALHPSTALAWAANVFESLKPVISSAKERGISAIVLNASCFADRIVAEAFRDQGLRATGCTVYPLAPQPNGAPVPASRVLELTTQLPVKYRVVNVGSAIFDDSNMELAHFVRGRKVFAVVDARVMNLYGSALTAYLQRHTELSGLITMKGDESAKHWKNVERVCTCAFECNVERDSIIVAIGGGIVMDIVGVAASLYRRGINYLRIPTTLIGMVDVAVGIKHGFNFGGRKNALGTFYPPIGAIADRRFLTTLSRRHLRCGLAEVLKMGIICEPRLFDLIEQYAVHLMQTRFASPPAAAEEIVLRAQASMMRELQHNLFEHDKRRLADFGHTLSPALEAATNYRIHHGEAVAIDMMLSCAIALDKGLCTLQDYRRIRQVYAKIGLPAVCSDVTTELIERAMQEGRRHRGGSLNLVVPMTIGNGGFVQQVSADDIGNALSIVNSG